MWHAHFQWPATDGLDGEARGHQRRRVCDAASASHRPHVTCVALGESGEPLRVANRQMLTALALPDAVTWPFTCQPVDCAAAVRELAQASVATTAAMRSRVAVGGCWRERRVGFMGNTRISSCRSRRWRLKHGSSVAAGGDDSNGVTRCAVRRQPETGAKFANHEYASDDARHATTFDETNPIAPRRHRRVVTGRSTAAGRPRLPAAADSRVEPARARRFGMQLRRWFRAHGRDLPWRRTRDPYRILVSELMLQQTQVSRVVPK